MDIYQKRRRGKILFLVIAILIGVASLLYTNWLTKRMAQEERKKVELWAEATRRYVEPFDSTDSNAANANLNTSYLTLIMAILEQNNTTIFSIFKRETKKCKI